MKGFTIHVLTSQGVEVGDLRRFPGVEDIRSHTSNSFTIKVSLNEFYNNDFGLRKVMVQEPINEYIKDLISFIRGLKYDVLEYRITNIEYSLFYIMEPGRTFNSYQYIFKILAGQCLFKSAEGTQDLKNKIITRARFGNTKTVNKATKKIEIHELGKSILDSKGEKKYNEVKGRYPYIDQILVFDIKLKIEKKLELKTLYINDAKKMALTVLTKYLFSDDTFKLYQREVDKSSEVVFQVLKNEKDQKGFLHKEVINRLLRKEQLYCFLSYALAVEKIYGTKGSGKTIKSRVKKLFTDIEEEDNLILIETLQYLEDMVKQIYKITDEPRYS